MSSKKPNRSRRNRMGLPIRLEQLNEQNFEAYSKFLNAHDSGCYCSFWHQKFSSMAEWDKRKAEEPDLNKSCMLDKIRSRFHLGVLAYKGDQIVAWVSVGPATDFYWAWRRLSALGDTAKTVAIIPCITRKKELRAELPESELLKALKDYGRTVGWSAIEGYPFDRVAHDKHGHAIAWAGFPEDFERAGYKRVGEHWLHSPEHSRSIYRFELN
jgi:hypothetical protein